MLKACLDKNKNSVEQIQKIIMFEKVYVIVICHAHRITNLQLIQDVLVDTIERAA